MELLQALLDRAPRRPAAAGVLLSLCRSPQMGDSGNAACCATGRWRWAMQSSDRAWPAAAPAAALAQLPLDSIERLIAAGADARVQDADGHNALTQALRRVGAARRRARDRPAAGARQTQTRPGARASAPPPPASPS